MDDTQKGDLRELLIDAHAHFFFLKGTEAMRVRLWQILPDGFIIDMPKGAPMRKTVLGYIPTLDGSDVYEIEGTVSMEPYPDQMPGTIRIAVDPSHVKKLNRRMYPRLNFTPPLDAEAYAEGEKRAIPVRIVNFSAGGLRAETKEELSPKKRYTFRFKIETEDEVHDLNLPGTIAYEVPSESVRAYGVRFAGTARDEAAKGGEAPVEELDRMVDLMGLINHLLARET